MRKLNSYSVLITKVKGIRLLIIPLCCLFPILIFGQTSKIVIKIKPDTTIVIRSSGENNSNITIQILGPKDSTKSPSLKKGPEIINQNLFCDKSTMFNISASIYPGSPQDSIMLYISSPNIQNIDTIIPYGFILTDLKRIIQYSKFGSLCNSDRIDSSLEDFINIFHLKGPLEISEYSSGLNIQGLKNSLSTASKKNDTVNDNIEFINAANFDFNGPLSADYTLVLRIFAPDFSTDHKWGIITGIEKINYNNTGDQGSDTSSNTNYFLQNLLADPDSVYIGKKYDTVPFNNKYYTENNQYTTTFKDKVWSFFIQPTMRLNGLMRYYKTNPKIGIYLHGHFELLVNNWTRTESYKTIQKDTFLVQPDQTRNSYYFLLPSPVTNNSTFLSGYFGGGITFYLAPFWRDPIKAHLFIQPTIGLAVDGINLNSLSNTSIPLLANGDYRTLTQYKNAQVFYLVKCNYNEIITSTIDLVIGFTVRGLFNNNISQYAAYVGLNLDLDALAKLISP